MYNNKLSPQIQLALKYENILSEEAFLGMTGNDIKSPIWEVLVTYIGDIDYVGKELDAKVIRIDDNFAIFYVYKDDIVRLSKYLNVGYVEFPEVMEYILDTTINSICVDNVTTPEGNYNLSGKGILIGIIDSGIDYTHPDFIDENGDSRIQYLWDQTEGEENFGVYGSGTEYTNSQITAAIKAPTKEEQEKIVPSKDLLGHGTAIAGIAGGNGRGSGGQYRGVAPGCAFVIVKIGAQQKNTDIMLGVKYVINKAVELRRPIALVVGFGINQGGHDGRNTLELFLAKASYIWKNNIAVGTGNQGNKDSHAEGVVKKGEEKVVQIFIAPDEKYYYFTLWTSFTNELQIQIEAPTGEKTEVLENIINNRAFLFGNTTVLVNFSEADVLDIDTQILVLLQSSDNTEINSGIWTVYITGKEVTDGVFNIWGSSTDPINRKSRFVQPNPNITLTIPSTTDGVTSVAAYNAYTNQIANFSGRGYTRNNQVKPDITAPGINIMAPTSSVIASEKLYAPVSGTSAAAACVAGGYALLMEFGNTENDEFLFGQRLKSYTLKNTRTFPQDAPFPNNKWGYGILCVQKVVADLESRYAVQSN